MSEIKSEVFNEDCIETMKRIPDGSIDLILTDPPYGITKCNWDNSINLEGLWLEWERIIKDDGVVIITASQPFTSHVVLSNIKNFKYELIWEKSNASGHLDAKKKPMKKHESILVFNKKGHPKYNVQKEISNNKSKGRIISSGNRSSILYGSHKKCNTYIDDGSRYCTSILKFQHDSERYNSSVNRIKMHPTQKPVELFRWLIKSYSNPGDTVFDGYLGSGTTAITCLMEGRNFIGAELNKEYYEMAMIRIGNHIKQLKLELI